jgi:hypothetical protein
MNGMITILKRGLPLLAVVLLLGSCYWSSEEDSGGITTEVQSESTSGSGDNTVTGEDGDIARAYLLSGGGMQKRVYQLSGQKQAYQQSKLSGGKASFTFESVPAGQTYEVLVAVGKLAGDNEEALDVHSYYRASDIEVTANATTDVDAERTVVQQLSGNPQTLSEGFMSYALLGNQVTGAVSGDAVEGDGLFASTQSTVHELERSGDLWKKSGGSIEMPDGRTINSLSKGISSSGEPVVLVNTTDGIRELSGTTTLGEQDFSTGLESGVSVLRSVEFGNSTDGYSLLFQQKGGIGFANYSDPSGLSNPDNWWTVDLSEYSIVGEPVLDFSVDQSGPVKGGYAATKLGAFSATVTSVRGKFDDGTWSEVQAAVNFLDDTVPDPVLSVGVAGGTLYLGTKNGAYRFPQLNDDGTPTTPTDTRELVAETRGYRIQDILVSDGGKVALISPLAVIVEQPDGSGGWNVTEVPFVALPNRLGERVSGTWIDGGNERLVLGGTEGLAVLYPEKTP